MEVSGCGGSHVGCFFQEGEARVGTDGGRGELPGLFVSVGVSGAFGRLLLGQRKPGWCVKEAVGVGRGEEPRRGRRPWLWG